MFTIGNSVDAYYRIYVSAGVLYGLRKIGATKTTLFSMPYDPVNHRFLRIRHNAQTGSVTLDTATGSSGTPGVWVQRFTETWHASILLTGMIFEVKGGTWQAEANAAGKVIFDNFRAARYYSLFENFNDNSLDSGTWILINPPSSAAVREVNQQLQITLQPNTAGYFGVRSASTYDLNDRTLQTEIVQPISQDGWTEQQFQLKRDDANYFHMSAGAGSLVMDAVSGGVRDRTLIPFDQANFRFWRFRHHAVANTINFETSPNGQNWATQKTVAVSFPLNEMYVVLVAGAFGAGNAWPGSAVFDNIVIYANESNSPPTISLSTPLSGAVFTEPAPIDLTAVVNDADGFVSKVEFFNGATKIGEDTVTPFAFQWTGVPLGRYSITAKATDNNGAVTTSAPVNIRVTQPDTIGVHRDSTFYLRHSNTSGQPHITQTFGSSAWKPVVGDWDGNGTSTLGTLVPDAAAFGSPGQSLFRLSNSTSSSDPDLSIVFGVPGDIPLAGDWDGNGTDTIGVYRPSNSTFYLRNSNSAGAADLVIPFSTAGDSPLAGDWNGDGVDTIGIHNSANGTFYLRNTNTSGSPDVTVAFGGAGNKPVVGDWDGNGATTLGVFVAEGSSHGLPGQSLFLLVNSFSSTPDLLVAYGLSGDKPLAGNWNGQLPPLHDASFVSQSIPSSMTAGRTYDVTVTMRNTGTETWTPEAGYMLGTQNPPDNTVFGNTALGSGRVALSAPVPPNGTTTFSFTITAPAVSGSYNFQRSMLRNGTWFGDLSTNVPVTVNAVNSISVTASDSVSAEPGTDTGTFVVHRTGDPAQALTVNYTLSGTAINGTDYATLPTSVIIPAGASEQTITLTPLNDALVEGPETVILNLSGNSAYVLGTPASATISIGDQGLGMVRPKEFITWTSLTNGIDAGNGTLRNTAASGVANAGSVQSLTAGDGYFEATASGYSQNLAIRGSDGSSIK